MEPSLPALVVILLTWCDRVPKKTKVTASAVLPAKSSPPSCCASRIHLPAAELDAGSALRRCPSTACSSTVTAAHAAIRSRLSGAAESLDCLGDEIQPFNESLPSLLQSRERHGQALQSASRQCCQGRPRRGRFRSVLPRSPRYRLLEPRRIIQDDAELEFVDVVPLQTALRAAGLGPNPQF